MVKHACLQKIFYLSCDLNFSTNLAHPENLPVIDIINVKIANTNFGCGVENDFNPRRGTR